MQFIIIILTLKMCYHSVQLYLICKIEFETQCFMYCIFLRKNCDKTVLWF